jgi:hypothetical protein
MTEDIYQGLSKMISRANLSGDSEIHQAKEWVRQHLKDYRAKEKKKDTTA